MMTLTETINYLDTLPGVLALFWFMENVNEEHPHRQELFFYCRERVRRYGNPPGFNERDNAWRHEHAMDAELFKYQERT